MKLPTIFTLCTLLRYEPLTGKLYWRERAAHQFRGGARRTPQHAARQFNSRFAGKEAFTALRNGYRCGCVDYSNLYAHRVIWALQTGMWPDEVDHINGDPQDNRWENLRAVNRAENCLNARCRRDNTSGVLGVQWSSRKGKWRARITRGGKQITLGFFSDLEAASAARLAAEEKLGFHPNHGRR